MSTNFAFAQVDSVYIVNKEDVVTHNPNYRANEIKVNGLYTLLGFPEITYERILSDETAAGISLALGGGNTINYNFMLTPYYRIYFGKKDNAAGFFIEGSGSAFSYKNSYYSNYNPYGNNDTKTEFGYGLGLAIGSKFMSRSQKWFGEMVYGIGRNFAQSEDYGSTIYPRAGINIGRRF
jgi:hypothetical protein